MQPTFLGFLSAPFEGVNEIGTAFGAVPMCPMWAANWHSHWLNKNFGADEEVEALGLNGDKEQVRVGVAASEKHNKLWKKSDMVGRRKTSTCSIRIDIIISQLLIKYSLFPSLLAFSAAAELKLIDADFDCMKHVGEAV